MGINDKTPDTGTLTIQSFNVSNPAGLVASGAGNVFLTLRSSSAIGDEGQFKLQSTGASDRLEIMGGATPTTFMTIASTGNVGIGTTGPTTKLDVSGNASISGNFEIGANLYRFNSTGASFSVAFENTSYGSSSATYGSGLTACSGSSFLQWSSTNGRFSCVATTPASSLQVRDFPGGTTVSSVATISFEAGHFNITSSGSIDAVVKLDWVSGPASRAGTNTWSGFNSFTAFASISPKLEIYNAGNADLELTNTQNTDGVFRLRSVGGATTARLDILGSASQTYVSIASSGNVGIGTTAPTAFLSIVSSTGTASMDFMSGGVTDKRFTIRSNYQGVTPLDTAPDRLSFVNGAGTEVAHIASAGIVEVITTSTGGITGSARGFVSKLYSTDDLGPALLFRKARGTVGSPSVVLSNDNIMNITPQGWDGSTWGNGPFIGSYATENWTTSAHGSNVTFFTVNDGATAQTERLRITQSGNVGIGTTAPTALTSFYSTATASFDITSQGQTDKRFTLRSHFQGAGTSERLSILNGANSELVSIASTGNVGIGNKTASESLHITGRLRIDNDNDSTNKGCFRYNNATVELQYSNDCSTFNGFTAAAAGGWNDDGAVVRLTTAADNVGIGTIVGTDKLNISGSNPRIRIIDTGGATTRLGNTVSGGKNVFHIGEAGISENDFVIDYTNDRIGLGTGDPAQYLDIAQSAANLTFSNITGPHQIITGGTSHLALMPGGSVGIGTTVPGAKLEVSGGDIKVTTAAEPFNGMVYSGDTSWGFKIQRTAATDDYNVRMSYYPVSGTRRAGIYNANAANWVFYADQNATPNIIMTNIGNVGIGTTTPATPLEIRRTDVPPNDEFLRLTQASNATGAVIGFSGYFGGAVSYRIGLTGDSGLKEFSIRSSVSADIFKIKNGNVGIGVPAGSVVQAKFEVSGTASLSNAIYLPNDGNVGIGTQGPLRKFEIFLANSQGGAIQELMRIRTGDATGAYLGFENQGNHDFLVGTTQNNGDFVVRASAGNSFLTVTRTGVIKVDLPGAATAFGVCKATSTGTTDEALVDCTGSDYAEFYETRSDVEPGDVVVATDELISFQSSNSFNGISQTGVFGKSTAPYQATIVGVISKSPYQIAGDDIDLLRAGKNVQPVSLAGRAPVKVSLENGPIAVGDSLTSSTIPGVAMKATKPGMIIGTALEPITSLGSVSYGYVMTFIRAGYWAPTLATPPSLQGLTLEPASTSGTVTVSSESMLDMLAQAAEVVMQKLRVTGDIIAQGVKKTYYSVAELWPNVDIATMAANWNTREIMIDSLATSSDAGLFRGSGVQAAGDSKVDLAENGAYLATYGVDSTRGEIQLSGTSNLEYGQAKVFFDYSFTSIISDKVPLKILMTPTSSGVNGQLYVATKTVYGFEARELNGASNGKFDWLVIARRKGFDTDYQGSTFASTPTPSPTISPETNPTSSPEISASPVPSPSVEPSPTPSEQITPTPTPAESPSPSPNPSPSPSESLAPTPEVSPAPTESPSFTPEPSPSPSPTIEPTP